MEERSRFPFLGCGGGLSISFRWPAPICLEMKGEFMAICSTFFS